MNDISGFRIPEEESPDWFRDEVAYGFILYFPKMGKYISLRNAFASVLIQRKQWNCHIGYKSSFDGLVHRGQIKMDFGQLKRAFGLSDSRAEQELGTFIRRGNFLGIHCSMRSEHVFPIYLSREIKNAVRELIDTGEKTST